MIALGGRRGDRGSATLELGVIVPVLLLFVYGTMSVLMVARANYAVGIAARDALRLVTRTDSTVADSVILHRVRLVTRAHGFPHDPSGALVRTGAVPNTGRNNRRADVNVTVTAGTRTTPAQVRVTMRVDLIGLPGSVTVTRTLSERRGAHVAIGAPP